NALDASDKDAGIAIQNWPVHGMYQPDAIASYEVGGETFLVTANEGDARDYDGYSEEERVKDLTLDPTVFTDTATLQADENLGRLKTTSAMGDANDDGLYEELYAYGARSFSIWDANGELVFDSADQFEQITAALAPTLFNSQGDAGSFDERSDDKGPEPEGVTVATLGGRVFAFIGLERVGGVMVYDVTNPESPVFVHYFMQPAGHISPEGLVFIAAADSPSGAPLLVMSNEVTGSLAILEVDFEFVLYLPQVFTE
ncbi:MAG: choice-of-anchor I family protein, partial [Anaerolineae bacterium]|nr:choice-of-anchor I family protein [Anaerolineae bacterium]